MIFNCPLLAVEDMNISRAFYENIMEQKVIYDFGENITFEGGFSLQTRSSWAEFIGKNESSLSRKSNDFELYFEEDNFDSFIQRLKNIHDIEYVHPVKLYPWGQRVIRFYDPDRHIIEVGESMRNVAIRFYKEGLSIPEIAKITQHPVAFVEHSIADLNNNK